MSATMVVAGPADRLDAANTVPENLSGFLFIDSLTRSNTCATTCRSMTKRGWKVSSQRDTPD
ncbi:MAG: hypothetical protein ABW003_23095 [Microvirga sp.]